VYIPDFIEVQRNSFRYLLKEGISKEISARNPISNNKKDLELIFYPEYYKLNPPELNTKQAILKAKTYACKIYIPAQLINYKTKEIKIQWILLGNLPLMTKRGHFIINGSPRIIINQILRSPGIYYQEILHKNKTRTYYADLISSRGTWLRIENDKRKKIWARMKKTPKISILVFLQAMGLDENSIFKSIQYKEYLNNSYLKKDHPTTKNEALITLYSKTHPKKDKTLLTPAMGEKFLFRKFFNPNSYDLSFLGRLRLNDKLNLSIPKTQTTLTPHDVLYITDYLIKLEYGSGDVDDIDNLKNRRVRTSGEIIQTQLSIGLLRLEKLIREKLKRNRKNLTLKGLITTKPINGALKEFFGSSQLSQFMDQTNPLAEITHKRRVTSVGPGGVSRETAGMAVRGIHPTHYGRICPIETPEGPNAGLVNSITSFGKINQQGFLETPYLRVYKGQVQKNLKCVFLSAKQEENFVVAPSDLKLSKLNFLSKKKIPTRIGKEFKQVFRTKVQYIAISQIQMISIATSLIPFLEHDDANRALMGSNMQRQAVPLMIRERPIVGTGLEARVISDSGHSIQSKKNGYISYIGGGKMIVHYFNQKTKKKEVNNHLNLIPQNCSVRKFATFSSKNNPYSKFSIFSYLFSKNKNIIHTNFSSLLFDKKENKLYFIPSSIKKDPSFIYKKLVKIKTRKSFVSIEIKEKPKLGSLVKNENILSLSTKKIDSSSSLVFDSAAMMQPLTGYYNRKNITENTTKKNSQKINIKKNNTNFSFFTKKINIKKQEIILNTFQRSNQETCLTNYPVIKEGQWVQKKDLLADGAASLKGELALGKNLLVAYMPWEGYNFEDAVLISERLVYEDLYTSIHIERFEIEIRDTKYGLEQITKQIPDVDHFELGHLDQFGVVKKGSWVKEGDILVGKITPINKKPLSPHEKLLYDIVGKEIPTTKDTSLRAPKGVKGRVIDIQILETQSLPPETSFEGPGRVHIYIAEKRKIQVGDKIAGRHGNKGIISKILPRQDMPYLPDGTAIDIVLNPLGVPSRMNVGQVFECLLGLAGVKLTEQYKITPFDETFGSEASRSIVFSKLYLARLRTKQEWLFNPNFPGKIHLFDGCTGNPFDQHITVGQAYILKLVHLVDEKIHARSTGPYSLVTQQPLRGRSKHGGQRLGEMEVWALEGFGAAFTLQELLTIKSDDMKGRHKVIDSILKNKPILLGMPESFKVLVRELQSLCLRVKLSFQDQPSKLKNQIKKQNHSFP
jgi:DNA-directed RNA polymerase beta subunit